MSFSIADRIKAYYKIPRVFSSTMIGWALFGAMIFTEKAFPPEIYLYVFLAGSLVAAHTMVFNDILDLSIDKINEPDRPIPSGKISKTQAMIYSVILLLLGEFFFLLVDMKGVAEYPYSWIFGIVHVTLANLYTWKLKKTGFPGNITVAWMSFAAFLYVNVFFLADPKPLIWLFGAAAGFTSLSREIVKGIMDVEGDREHDVKTIAVLFGRNKARYFAVIVLGLDILFGLLTMQYLDFIGNIGTILFALITLRALVLMLQGYSYDHCKKTKTIVLYAPLVMLVFVLIDIFV